MSNFDLSQADPELKKYLALDKELVAISKEFKILSLIEWPKETQAAFIKAYKAGQPVVPDITYKKHNFTENIKKLEEIIRETSTDHPIAQYIKNTAESYYWGFHMGERLGTAEMLPYSIKLYGRPGDIIVGSKYTSIEAAQFFIEIADQFGDFYSLENDDICILADTVRDDLQKALNAVITDDSVTVIVDDHLVPKAAAGVSRVRLRSGTCFSKYDFKQLLEHEVFVHTLTAINGREQDYLNSLSLGAPRTTATQEGLATFAELITGAIDINRLKRIALRVLGVDMALNGANFIEVFKFFIAKGQTESESYSSTQRIFRGGTPSGGAAFTKDSVYLDGLLHAHSFFRWAMKNHKLDLAQFLFSGRMTFEDAEQLAPFARSGVIRPPKYLPPWLSQVHTLGGYLAFSLFANKIRVGALDKDFAAQ